MADSTIALLCMFHPVSKEKQTRCLDVLRRSAREYYRSPRANCTTWSYFTPSPLLKSNSTNVRFGGLEIYTTKQAFSDQLNDSLYFQPYRKAVVEEELYAQPAEHTVWYPAVGFVARGIIAEPFGDGAGNVVVSLTHFVCKDFEKAFGMFRPFAEWVERNEPFVLTYQAFTRPKAPNEFFLFIRYRGTTGLIEHDGSVEHQNAMKELEPFLERPIYESTTIWQEVEDSFVSNIKGGKETSVKL